MARGAEAWEMLRNFARCPDRSKGWSQAPTRSATMWRWWKWVEM